MKEIEHGEITTRKYSSRLFEAMTVTTKPFKTEIRMKAKTEEIARQKLELFLQNKPYKHLD